MENQTAAFRLEGYLIKEVKFFFEEKQSEKIDINFSPSGIFFKDEGKYILRLDFTAKDTLSNVEIIHIQCLGTYFFENVSEEIPEFFYQNAIAILFPYLRAFISTLTVQSNTPPLILPTYNLSLFGPKLKEETVNQ